MSSTNWIYLFCTLPNKRLVKQSVWSLEQDGEEWAKVHELKSYFYSAYPICTNLFRQRKAVMNEITSHPKELESNYTGNRNSATA